MNKLIEKAPLVFSKLHSLLALLVLLSWIVIEFNARINNAVEITPPVYIFADKITYLSAFLNFALWCLIRNYKNIALAIAFLIVSVTVNHLAHTPFLYNYVLICIAIANLKVRTCICFASVLVAVLIGSAFFANLTEIGNETFVEYRNGGFRYSFGQGHPNGLGASLLFLAVTFWTLFKSKLSHIVFIAINLVLYMFLVKYVDSRTAQICLILSCILIGFSLVYDTFKDQGLCRLKKIISFLLIIAFPVIAITVLLVSYFYDPNVSVLSNLNGLLSTRIQLSQSALVKYGLSLLGNSAVTASGNDPTGGDATLTAAYEFIDSFYVYVAVRWGLLSLLVYSVINFIVVKNSLLSGNYRIAVALLVFSIHAISEVYYFNVSCDILIFLVFMNFFDKKFTVNLPFTISSVKNSALKISAFTIVLIKEICSVSVIVLRFLKNIYVNYIKHIPFGRYVSCVSSNKEDCKLFDKIHLFAAIAYCSVLIVAFVCFFDYLIDYFKTVLNLLDLSEIYSKNLYILIFAVGVAVVLLFAKSVFYIFFYIIFRRKLSLRFTKVLLPLFFSMFSIAIGGGFYCDGKIEHAISDRKNDIQLVKSIVDDLNQNNQNFSVYIDEIPNVYRRVGIDVKSKLVFFDSVILDDKTNIVFANPKDEHIKLFKNGYRYSQLTPTLSVYVKDTNVINILEKKGISLSDKYTFVKVLNLKRIAFINNLRYKNCELYLKDMYHQLNKVDNLYLTPGKYRFTIDYNYDHKNIWLKDDKLFKFILTSNDGALTIYEKTVFHDKSSNGKGKLSFDFELSDSRHSVNMQISSFIMNHLNFSKISYEKYE